MLSVGHENTSVTFGQTLRASKDRPDHSDEGGPPGLSGKPTPDGQRTIRAARQLASFIDSRAGNQRCPA